MVDFYLITSYHCGPVVFISKKVRSVSLVLSICSASAEVSTRNLEYYWNEDFVLPSGHYLSITAGINSILTCLKVLWNFITIGFQAMLC